MNFPNESSKEMDRHKVKSNLQKNKTEEPQQKYWPNELENLLRKAKMINDDGCEVHHYLMGDGRCDCKERRDAIKHICYEIIKIIDY